MAGESESPDETHPTEYARCRTHAATAHVSGCRAADTCGPDGHIPRDETFTGQRRGPFAATGGNR
jgi:hypothetical protein